MKFAWTEESTAALIELVESRKLYSEIAVILTARFGFPVDKNMISGKVFRLKIGQGPYRPAREVKTQPGATNGERVLPDAPAPDGFRYVFQGPAGQRALLGLVPVERPVVLKNGLTLLELRDSTCRWPLWAIDEKPEIPRYCGAETKPGAAYCPRHHKIAYTPAAKRVPMTEEQRLARRIAQLRRHEQMRVDRAAREAAALKKERSGKTKELV